MTVEAQSPALELPATAPPGAHHDGRALGLRQVPGGALDGVTLVAGQRHRARHVRQLCSLDDVSHFISPVLAWRQ